MNTDTCPVPSASSAPSMTGMLNRPKLSVVIRPTVNERPASRAWASVLGAKPSRCAASATRSRVSARSLPCPLSALEAVPMDTPASAATSRMVTRLMWYSSALAAGLGARQRRAPGCRWAFVRAAAVDASRASL